MTTDEAVVRMVARHEDIINGNEETGLVGLRPRVIELESWRESIDDKEKQIRWMAKGILIGLSVTSVASLATAIITVLKLLTG